MPSVVDRVNRTLLALLGLLLLAVGVLVLLLGFGVFGTGRAEQTVLTDDESTFITDNPWFWWAVAAVCVVVALLCLRWLLGQLSTSRVPELEVEPDHSDGRTMLQAGAIAGAVEDEVRSYPGVADAALRLQGTRGDHRHLLTVALDERADVDAVRRALTAETVPHLRQALDFEDPQIDIRLVLAPRRRRRIN